MVYLICVKDIADRSFLVSSSALDLYDGDFAGGLLLVGPLESWLELHLHLVFTLREIPVPLVTPLDGCRCVPAGGVGPGLHEDALAAHVVLGEIQVGAGLPEGGACLASPCRPVRC